MSDPATSDVARTTTSTAINTARLAKTVDALPTLPVVAIQLGELVHSRNVSVQQVASLMANDPSTSAKLLKLVNSPYFGIPGGVTDIARAIPFIGFNTLYQLVLSVGVLDTLGAAGMRELWLHSLAVASIARELATEVRYSDPGGCFTAGLLHDMGTIALAKLEPAKFAASRAAMSSEHLTVEQAEERHGLMPHDQVGSALARAWRFPATLTVPIERHHDVHLSQVRARLTPNLRSVAEIVAVSDLLAVHCTTMFGSDAPTQTGERDRVEEMFAHLGFSRSQETTVLDRGRRQLEKSKVFLAVVK